MTRELSNITAEEASTFIQSRRSVRDFKPDAIPAQLLEEILKDALSAPSWSNTRPFKIVLAEGATMDRISAEFLKRWSYISHQMARGKFGKLTLFIRRYGLPTSNKLISKPYAEDLKPRAFRVGKELYGHLKIDRKDKAARDDAWAQNYRFFGAPTELFIYVHKSLDIFSASDAGLMIENLMLSAHARGLGTCAQGAVAIWDDVVRSEFNIPNEYRLLCGIAIGYPSDAHINEFKAHRISPEEVLIRHVER